jgi:hypothetical protein
LRQVRFGDEDSAQALQDVDQQGVGGGGLERKANVAESGIVPLHVELIFEGHGHAVEGTDRGFVRGEMAVK